MKKFQLEKIIPYIRLGKMNNKLLIWAIVLLISINLVNAIGISPGRTTIDFKPNLEQEVEFKVFNNEHKDMNVIFYVEGELNNTVYLTDSISKFAATDDVKLFKYKVKLPNDIKKPGAYDLNIVAREVPITKSGEAVSVGATAAVVTQLKILVPYPGKFVEASIRVSETGLNGPITFIIPIRNLGTQTIVRAEGILDIIGPTNEKIDTIKTEVVSLQAGEATQLKVTWDTSKFNAGKYLAKLAVTYDGEVANAEMVFNYGQALIEVLDVYVKDFKLGQIAKFNILVQNKFSEDINDVFATMDFLNEKGDLVISIKSASEDIKVGAKEELVAFWDTAGVKEGTYDAILKINYLDKVTEKELKAIVGLNSIQIDFVGATAKAIAVKSALSNNSLLMFGIFVLVIINIAWFVYFKRREKKKG